MRQLLALLFALLACAAAAQEPVPVAASALAGQEWRYFLGRSPTVTVRTYRFRESRGSLGVEVASQASGGMVTCYRGTVDARAERVAHRLVVTLVPAFAGCEQLRVVLEEDGTGWEEQRLAEGWVRTNYRLQRISAEVAAKVPAAAQAAAASPPPAVVPPPAAAPVLPAPARPAVAEAPKPAASSAPNDELRRTQQMLDEMRQQIAALQRERANAPAATPQVPHQSARALVIGNGRYTSFGRLANPARDAQAIAQKLRGFGIPVDVIVDADRDTLIKSLNEYSRKAAGTDVNILFYAGHGVQVEGTNYIIPVNMAADGISAGYVKLAGISLNATLDYMPGKTRLVFLDACRDNPATRTLVGQRGGAAGLAPISVASGTLIAYSTRDGATADDGDGVNSPYTSALLQHLDTPADISLVLRDVRQTVLKATGGRQEPWEYGSLVGGQLVLPLIARK